MNEAIEKPGSVKLVVIPRQWASEASRLGYIVRTHSNNKNRHLNSKRILGFFLIANCHYFFS